jgi:hypothetical protein
MRESDRTEGNTFVQAAHPITLQIYGDVLIPDGAQLAHEPFAYLGLECTRQLVAPDFEPSQGPIRCVVVAHTTDTEAHGAHGVFGTLDDLQLFRRDLGMIWDA